MVTYTTDLNYDPLTFVGLNDPFYLPSYPSHRARWIGLICMSPPMLNTPETGLTYVWMTNLIANRSFTYSYNFSH